jgi:hypothetical protein
MPADPKLTAKVMKLKWSKGITLKEAWKKVNRKKKKESKSTSKKVKQVKCPKRTTTQSDKKPKKVSSVKKEINGRMRTIYTSSRGAKYYKSKGVKVYVK